MAWKRLAELECEEARWEWKWDAYKGFELSVGGRTPDSLVFHEMANLEGDERVRMIIEVDDA